MTTDEFLGFLDRIYEAILALWNLILLLEVPL